MPNSPESSKPKLPHDKTSMKHQLHPISDVDTPEPDEKSIITYVSQLYDVFPEPPPGHPLFDAEGQKKLQQFRELASSLHHWIKEHIVVMQDRNFPNTLIEMKRWVDCQRVIILSVVQIFNCSI